MDAVPAPVSPRCPLYRRGAARPPARRRPASEQGDDTFGLDLIFDGLERMACR